MTILAAPAALLAMLAASSALEAASTTDPDAWALLQLARADPARLLDDARGALPTSVLVAYRDERALEDADGSVLSDRLVAAIYETQTGPVYVVEDSRSDALVLALDGTDPDAFRSIARIVVAGAFTAAHLRAALALGPRRPVQPPFAMAKPLPPSLTSAKIVRVVRRVDELPVAILGSDAGDVADSGAAWNPGCVGDPALKGARLAWAIELDDGRWLRAIEEGGIAYNVHVALIDPRDAASIAWTAVDSRVYAPDLAVLLERYAEGPPAPRPAGFAQTVEANAARTIEWPRDKVGRPHPQRTKRCVLAVHVTPLDERVDKPHLLHGGTGDALIDDACIAAVNRALPVATGDPEWPLRWETLRVSLAPALQAATLSSLAGARVARVVTHAHEVPAAIYAAFVDPDDGRALIAAEIADAGAPWNRTDVASALEKRMRLGFAIELTDGRWLVVVERGGGGYTVAIFLVDPKTPASVVWSRALHRVPAPELPKIIAAVEAESVARSR